MQLGEEGKGREALETRSPRFRLTGSLARSRSLSRRSPQSDCIVHGSFLQISAVISVSCFKRTVTGWRGRPCVAPGRSTWTGGEGGINMYTRRCAREGGRGGLQGADLCVKPTDRPIDRAAGAAASRIRDAGEEGGGRRLQKGPFNRRSLPLHRILISAATSRSPVRLSTDMKREKKNEKKRREKKTHRARARSLCRSIEHSPRVSARLDPAFALLPGDF